MCMKKNYFKDYKKHGYLIIKNILKDNEIKKIKEILIFFSDKKFSQILNVHNFSYLLTHLLTKDFIKKKKIDKYLFLKDIHKKSEILKNVYKNKKITDILDKLYKKEIFGLQTQVIYKKPDSRFAGQSFNPHQDNSYARNPNGNFFTTHIFLDDSDRKNGTIYVYDKSHKDGLFNFNTIKSLDNPKNPGNKINVKNLEKKFKKIDIDAKAGDLLIMHGHLVHGSYPNLSKKKSRMTYTLCAIPKNERFIKGYNAQREIFSLR